MTGFLCLGKSDEQRAAAGLACLLCVQLGSGIESEEMYKTLAPILKKILCDASASVQARQAVSKKLVLGMKKCKWMPCIPYCSDVCVGT